MYHNRFRGKHYDIGFQWGSLLKKHGNFILDQIDFPIDEERMKYAQECAPIYREYFPEILEEIQGIADGQECSVVNLQTFLFSMYAIPPSCCCSCFAVSNGSQILLGRNSDFLVRLEKSNMNVIYKFSENSMIDQSLITNEPLTDSSYSFTGNTTAFVEMEDGVNEYGLAAGLTSVYPHAVRPGMNAGMLLRLFLEKCRSVEEAIRMINQVPVGSAQTFTIADAAGDIAVLECNCERTEVIRPAPEKMYVCATNLFHSKPMEAYTNTEADNWEAQLRYETLVKALEEKADKIQRSQALDILCGKDGFICQYDRKTGKDTVWSVIYDLKAHEIFRAEGNPGRKSFRQDKRFLF